MVSDSKSYTYVFKGVKQEVYCNRHWYLFLKLNYDDNGLTPKEYREYKEYLNGKS